MVILFCFQSCFQFYSNKYYFYSILCYAMPCYSILLSFYSILMYRSIGVRGLSQHIYIYINLYVYPYPSYLFVHLCTYLLVWHWPRDHWMRGLQDNRACTMQDYVDCGLPKKPEFDDHLQMLRGFCQSEFCIVLYHHGCRTCSSSLSCRPSLCLTFAICRGWVDYDLQHPSTRHGGHFTMAVSQ